MISENSKLKNLVDPTGAQDGMTLNYSQGNFPQQYSFTGTTTNATPATLGTIALDAATTTFITVFIVARCTGGSAGVVNDGLGFVIHGAFKVISGTATQIGISLPTTMQDKALWSASMSVSGGNVLVKGVGAANTNISWKAVYQLTKI